MGIVEARLGRATAIARHLSACRLRPLAGRASAENGCAMESEPGTATTILARDSAARTSWMRVRRLCRCCSWLR